MNYIADAKTKYFESKEQYLAMRKSFAAAVNNKDIHLQAEHFMFYNAVREKDITAGFRDVGPKKIYHQGWVNLKASEARSNLAQLARGSKWGLSMETFQEVFGMTEEQICRVIGDMPTVPQKIDNNRGMSYDNWLNEYLSKQLSKLRSNMEQNSTPLEPWAREALDKALKDSAELVSEGRLVS